MESSSLVSWQFENFSSAKLNLSPPDSPSTSPPPSPSLYNGRSSIQNNKADYLHAGGKVGAATLHQGSKSASIRAQLASTILNDLEEKASVKVEFNDFGLNWNEESVNLNLFEELAEIEYTPPSSPKRSSPAANLPSTSNAVNIQLLSQPVHTLNGQVSESSADISSLTAEFQAILDSLPKDSDNTEALSHVLQIAGIPTTIIDGEALVPVELDLTGITQSDLLNNNIDMEDIDNVYVQDMSDNDSDIIEESELYEISNQGSPAYSVHSNSNFGPMLTTTVVDQHSEAAQKILDALLLGDVATAETYLPDISRSDEEDDDSSMSSEDSYHPLPSPPRARPVVEKKPERRGRKPTKKVTKGSSGYVKDKIIRKKEQNKTAATRYRQKKKLEFSVILESEAELQQEHDNLEKKKDDLQREILMVKQLLRDVIQSRKPATANNKTIIRNRRR
jgi:hypothetical protein